MNIFYFSSDLYARIAMVSMISLLHNNKSAQWIHFYIADDKIEEETKQKITGVIQNYNADISFIELPDPSELLDYPFKDRYQIGHSYPRMCISQLLPEQVDRVICLDSDTLVLGDLGNLWNLDLKNNILAGVTDCMNLEAYNKQFALKPDQIYCNAGVFLVDLKKWREEKIEDKIKKTIRKNKGNVFFFEQTLMNYSCRGKIYKLPAYYNVYTLFYAFKYENLILWRQPSVFYTKKEVNKAIEHPVIVHFTRNFYMKSHPWKKGSTHPLANVYRKYMQMTPWNNLWIEKIHKVQEKKYRLWHLIPQKVLCLGASFLYNVIRPKMWWRNE